MDEVKYIHPIKDIDQWIHNEDLGMSMMLDDTQKMEMKLRRKQIAAEEYGYDEYEDDEFVNMAEEHAKMTEKLQQKNAATHKHDIPFRPLKPEIRRQLEHDMMISIVRKDPTSEYNKTDQELFGDKEKREIFSKLSRLRNKYFNVPEYVAAMKSIIAAIEYSLGHDYPWLSNYDAIRMFNEGKIKLLINIPKLYLGYGTEQITDPEILTGIIAGDIKVIDKDEEDKKVRSSRKDRVPYTPVSMSYTVVRDDEANEYTRLHNMGIDTPISHILKNKSQLFDRLSMPFTFSNQQQQTQQQIKPEDLIFDWTQPNAGDEFYCYLNGIKRHTQSNLIDILLAENNNELRPDLAQRIRDWVYEYNHPTRPNTNPYEMKSPEPLRPTDQALQLEQQLLQNLRMNNPNL